MVSFTLMGSGIAPGTKTTDFALTDSVLLVRQFCQALVGADTSLEDIELYGAGKLLPDEPIANFIGLRNGGQIMVRVRKPVSEEDPAVAGEAVVFDEAEPAAPEAELEEWWLGLPDSAPARWDEELRAFLCEPVARDPETKEWVTDADGSERCMALSSDCPRYGEGRWSQEYHIPPAEWAKRRPTKTVTIAFRFPKDLGPFPDEVRYARTEAADRKLYPRYGAVMVRPEKEKMTEETSLGKVLVAKKEPKGKAAFRVVEKSVLVLELEDERQVVQPNLRLALLKLAEPKDICRSCKVDDDRDCVYCDECDEMYHFGCTDPPLSAADVAVMKDWYCKECRNEQTEAHVISKRMRESKVAKAAEAGARKGAGKSNQSWKGAFKGTVSPNRVGPVFGCQVGQHEANRTDLAIMGVHQNHMSSFVLSKTRPAHVVSLALSGKGSYESRDLGDVVVTDGPGGRDLSGEKGDKNARTGKLKNDQAWSGALGHNIAMARACAAFNTFFDCPDCHNPLYGEAEFESKPFRAGKNAICEACQARWREGVPIRLVRGAQDGNAFAPDWGYRYDGIYKVRQFWMDEREPAEESKPRKKKKKVKKTTSEEKKEEDEKEEEEEEEKEEEEAAKKTLVKVCCYELVRDDEVPAPWTAEGKATIARYGLDLPPRSVYRKKIVSSMKMSDMHLVADSVPALEDRDARPKTKKELYEALVAAGKVGDVELVPAGQTVREDFTPPVLLDNEHPAYLAWRELWRTDDVFTDFWRQLEEHFESGEYALRTKAFFRFTDALQTQFTCALCIDMPLSGLRVTSCCKQVLCLACTKRSAKHSEQKKQCPYCRAESSPKAATPELLQLLRQVFEGKLKITAAAAKKSTASKTKKPAAAKKPKRTPKESEEFKTPPSKKKRARRGDDDLQEDGSVPNSPAAVVQIHLQLSPAPPK